MRLIKDGVNYFALTKEDNYLERIKEYIKINNAISISRIQSEFAVGYPKASKIMSQLIEERLVKVNADSSYTIIR